MGKSFDDALREAFIAGAISMLHEFDEINQDDKNLMEDNFQEWKRRKQRAIF